MVLRRRGFLAGLSAFLAAPAIIRTPGLLMPVKPVSKVASAVEPIIPAFAPVFEDELFMGGRRVPLGADAGLMTFDEVGGLQPIRRGDPRLSRDQYGNLVRLGGWQIPDGGRLSKADFARIEAGEARLAEARYLETGDPRAAADMRYHLKCASMQAA